MISRTKQGNGTVILNTERFFDGNHKHPAVQTQVISDANCNALVVTAIHVGSTFDGDGFNTTVLAPGVVFGRYLYIYSDRIGPRASL